MALIDFPDPFAGTDPNSRAGLISGVKQKYYKKRNAEQAQFDAELEQYRKALEKATYAQLGPEFSSGLERIQNYLAGAGPLADSGARTALSRNLYSQILQRAQGQIGGSYADLLSSLLKQRQQYRYQSELLKQQKNAQSKKWYDYAIPAAASVAGAYYGG